MYHKIVSVPVISFIKGILWEARGVSKVLCQGGDKANYQAYRGVATGTKKSSKKGN